MIKTSNSQNDNRFFWHLCYKALSGFNRLFLIIFFSLVYAFSGIANDDTDGDGVGDDSDTDKIVFYQKLKLGVISESDIHVHSGGDNNDNADDYMEDMKNAILAFSGSTIHVIGEFPQHAVRKYTNNVNLEKFESTSATSVYYIIENAGEYSGKHYLDEYWGEINETAYKEVRFEDLRFDTFSSANGVYSDFTIRMPGLEVGFDLGVPSGSNTVNHNFDSESAGASFKNLNIMFMLNVGGSYFNADYIASNHDMSEKLFKTYYVPLADVEALVFDAQSNANSIKPN